MTPPLALAQPSGHLYRIGRRPDAWAWPDWRHAGDDLTFGNRYDDPRGQYRVLYASDARRGAFAETLARFRPDLAIVAEYEHIEGDPADEAFAPALAPGVVPAEWLDDRAIGTATHGGRFADVGRSDSVAHLRAALAGRVLHYGFDDFDAGDLRRRAPRALTQEISRHLFERGRDPDGEPVAGLRYLSRLGDDLANWAIFEPNQPGDRESEPIEHGDGDLRDVLALFGLTLR
jgi:RES domain